MGKNKEERQRNEETLMDMNGRKGDDTDNSSSEGKNELETIHVKRLWLVHGIIRGQISMIKLSEPWKKDCDMLLI